MSRIPVPSGATQTSQLAVFDTYGKIMAVSIQNLGAVDVYFSEDPNRLQSTGAGNTPNVGHHLPPDPVPPNPPVIVVYPFFNGKIYFRATGPGGAVEVQAWDVGLADLLRKILCALLGK